MKVITKEFMKWEFLLFQRSQAYAGIHGTQLFQGENMLFRCKSQVHNIFFGPEEAVHGKFPVFQDKGAKIKGETRLRKLLQIFLQRFIHM